MRLPLGAREDDEVRTFRIGLPVLARRISPRSRSISAVWPFALTRVDRPLGGRSSPLFPDRNNPGPGIAARESLWLSGG